MLSDWLTNLSFTHSHRSFCPTSGKKLKRGKFYNVERVIEQRKTEHVRYSDDFVFAKVELKTQINSIRGT